ncbi:hypothetical protein [Sphingomonas prati]|uniref:Hpt domain-containing protein n=1 Tax=Sphingomonas prati TaxID=1843237 RepID=A0A7W9BSM6_9SPHN|nr:hypothetical protein [Sphingomonas prati]MBB5729189.1 hypothetical protein [Sphingomonas prati]
MATAYRQDDENDMAAATRLCGRIAVLEADLPTLSLDRLMQRVVEIRGTARLHGLSAVVGIAAELATAIGRDGRAALIRPYLAGLREACGCAPGDDHAVHALLASISVRFAD